MAHEESKYYTPAVEEFYSGFEHEYLEDGKWVQSNEFSNNWYYEENPHYAVGKGIEAKTIRVKYLDREDIESLGFLKSSLYPQVYLYKCQVYFEHKNEFCTVGLNWNKDTKNLIIFYVPDPLKVPAGVNLFVGNIKNKSELKRLLKQLGIHE